MKLLSQSIQYFFKVSFLFARYVKIVYTQRADVSCALFATFRPPALLLVSCRLAGPKISTQLMLIFEIFLM